MHRFWIELWCIWLLIARCSIEACSRKPQGASGDRSPVDENFRVLIEGNPPTYIPGQRYNISLSCDEALKFISFTLVVESENAVSLGYDMLGRFELIDSTVTRFSTLCENMIESTNANTKTRISVGWLAPTNPESGCVLIKAAVLQHRNVWFIDDGFLTKRICPEEIDEMNSQTPLVDPCCACDEAKYELIVERKWTRNTHAKDFPVEAWRTRLSELIGASHTQDYRFWEYGSRASRGLQEMAQHGATQTLEAEIKAGKVRTIIKAPGIMHRNNIVGITLANVRVDPSHHLISLVSKVEPSPDWILGVAGLELCLENCTWITQKELNLYPWDIGTDAGPSYMSPDQPQIPPDVVRRITSTFPSDQRSPFYDETGAPMKPLATLKVTRKKLYERECESAESIPLECATHPWNSWSECTTKCGPGTQYRTRAYKDPTLAVSFNCQVVLRQTQKCVGEQCGAPENEMDTTATAECELTPWSSWSMCSKRCGRGLSTRTRNFVNPYAREKCLSGVPVDLEQTRDCDGNDCGGTITTNNQQTEDEELQPLGSNEENDLYGTNNGMDELTERYPNRFQPNRWGNQENLQPTENTPRRRPFYNEDRSNSRYDGRQFQDVNRSNDENIEEETGDIDENKQTDSERRFPDRFQRPGYTIEDNNQTPSDRRFNKPYTPGANRASNRGRNNFRHDPNSYGSYNRSPGDEAGGFNYGGNDEPQMPEEFDQNGRRTQMVEGGDPSTYTVVQEYCFEKPYPMEKPCRMRHVIVQNYWFYDADDRQCKLFTTDNCDENQNKFRSLEACEGTCQQPQQNLDELGEEDQWSGQFGQPRSLVRKQKPQRRQRKKQQQQQNQYSTWRNRRE